MDTLLADLRYTVRRLLQRPGFTIVAILTMALGIGANSAIFSIVNAILLRPLPVESPGELVEIYSREGDEEPVPNAYPDFLDIQERDDLFTGVAGYTLDFLSMDVGDRTEVVLGEAVSGNYFEVLGIPAARGRTFIAGEDDAPGAALVVVLSDRIWRRRFAADPNIIGKTLRLKGQRFEVVGVASPEFKGLMVGFASQMWTPVTTQPSFGEDLEDRGSRWLMVKGRLRPGVTPEQAQSRMDVLGRQLAATYPETSEDRSFTIIPTNDVRLHPMVDRALFPVAALLMVVVGLLLLIVCTNLANLLLARALARRREIAIRLAIGAGRGRLIRLLLTESLVLALLGGVFGLLIAISNLLVSFQPPIMFQLTLDLGIDGSVLAFTFFVSVLAGVFFGLAPALQATKPQLVPALKDELDAIGGRRRRFGLRDSLVVAQVATSLVLLIGAGLFVRSLISAQDIDLGFERERVAIIMLSPTVAGYEESRGTALLSSVVERARTLPGVEAAALASRMPLGVSVNTNEIFVEGVATPEDEAPNIDAVTVSSGYFDVMGIPLLQGRDFQEQDDESAPLVAIVSDAAARRFWPGENAVGKRFRLSPEGELREIIGIALDTKVRTLGEQPRPYLYMHYLQRNRGFMALAVRTNGYPQPMLSTLRREILMVDDGMPIMESKTMTEHLGIMLFAPRMGGILLGVFGGLGILLATIGLYGVVSYAAAQRTREVGIRVALGARPADVMRLVVGRGLTMVGVGIAIGLALAFAAALPLGSLLYGISVTDPVTFVGVTLLLVGVAFVATMVPALRASKLDPMVALRRE
jgi:predicted permease